MRTRMSVLRPIGQPQWCQNQRKYRSYRPEAHAVGATTQVKDAAARLPAAEQTGYQLASPHEPPVLVLRVEETVVQLDVHGESPPVVPGVSFWSRSASKGHLDHLASNKQAHGST